MKRLIGFSVGLVYAILVAFFLMLLTGGGHGNFVPFVFFLLTTMFGLLYPALGTFLADTKPLFAKTAIVGLLIINIFLICLFFGDPDFVRGNTGPKDDISLSQTPLLTVLMSILLTGPQVCSLVQLIRDIARNGVKP